MPVFSSRPYGWVLNVGKVDFHKAHHWQRGLVKMRKEGMARDTIMLVQHPPVVTIGRDGHEEHYQDLKIEPVFIERGGDVTYHGPGQLVAYFIFNLTRRGRDLHMFMANLQEGIIETFDKYDIKARKDDEHTGVWVDDRKIASIGIAVKNWITFHGVAINLNTNLDDFRQIHPCGLEPKTMISAAKLRGKKVNIKRFGDKLVAEYERVFRTRFEQVELESLAEDIESQAGGYSI